MKNILFLIIAIIFFTKNSIAQKAAYRQGCDFLMNLNYKNGVDTIIVLAYKSASVRMPPYEKNLRKLSKEKKLNYKDFFYVVDFKPLGCDDTWAIMCRDTSALAFNINESNYHKALQLRCIVFEGYFEFLHPFFIIDKITPMN